jgi:hypothetical protein
MICAGHRGRDGGLAQCQSPVVARHDVVGEDLEAPARQLGADPVEQ